MSPESYHKAEFFSYHVSQILSHGKTRLFELNIRKYQTIFYRVFTDFRVFFQEKKAKKYSGFSIQENHRFSCPNDLKWTDSFEITMTTFLELKLSYFVSKTDLNWKVTTKNMIFL